MMQLTRNFNFVALVGPVHLRRALFLGLKAKDGDPQLAPNNEAPSRVTKMSALGTKRPQAKRGITSEVRQ